MELSAAFLEDLAWLRRVVVGLTGEADAEDITQEVALDALCRPPSADGEPLRGRRRRAWLWTVARRKATKARARRRTARAGEQAAARSEVEPRDARATELLRLYQDLLREIEALDGADSELLVMRYLHEMPPREIAASLDVPDAVLRKRLSRALERLRERLRRSERGVDEWGLALAVIARPSAEYAAASRALADRNPRYLDPLHTVRRTVSSAAFLAATGAATLGALVLLLRTPDRANDAPLASRGVESARVEPRHSILPERASDEIVTGRVAARRPSLPEDATRAMQNLPPDVAGELLFVDEKGERVSKEVRAVWIDEVSEPHRLEVDAGRAARVPSDARGRIYAGAEGHELRDLPIAWSPDGVMRFELRRQRRIEGRITVNGEAPGESVALWAGRSGTNRWPHEVHRDARAKAALTRAGLVWPHDPVTADASGAFVFVTRATWPDYFLRPPLDLSVIRVVGTLHPDGVRHTQQFVSTTPRIEIDTARQPHCDLRLTFEDDGSAPDPQRVWVRCVTSDGETHRWTTFTDAQGRIVLPTIASGSVSPVERYTIEADSWSVAASLDAPGVPQDLGVITIPRAPLVHFEVVVRTGSGELAPVPAAICATDGTSVLADERGRARLRAALGSEVWALADGTALRRALVASSAKNASTPQRIELVPGTVVEITADVETAPGGRMNDEALSVAIWPSAARSEDELESPWPVHRRLYGDLHGRRFRLGHHGPRGSLEFAAPSARPLRLSGLDAGRSIQVALVDRFDGVLAEKQVVLPREADVAPVRVHFDDLRASGAARLSLVCQFPGTGQPYRGRVDVLRVNGGRIEHYWADAEGHVEAGPLLPGRYRVIASTFASTAERGQGTEIRIEPGFNEHVIEATGRSGTR